MEYNRLPTIPEYYAEHINKNVDLESRPKQCCPFHKEDTPSFSYSAALGRWRCFGGCDCGGDVIDLHKKLYNIRSRKEAEESIKQLYHIPLVQTSMSMDSYAEPLVDTERIRYASLLSELNMRARNSEQYCELDQAMSYYPVDIERLQDLLDKWKGV